MIRKIWRILAVTALMTMPAVTWMVWQPYPRSGPSFDQGRNGLWIGHRWYTGFEVGTGRPVADSEFTELLMRVRRNHIRYLYVHAGPVRSDGSIRDRPGPLLYRLRAAAPELTVLPWLGSRVTVSTFQEPTWRRRFIETVAALRQRGLDGVHLDFEPLRDHHPGYVELLREIRRQFGERFFISHATRRAGPFGLAWGSLGKWCWSRSFYRATMAVADQTVLMGYDTKLSISKLYVGFMKHETQLLLAWGLDFPHHRVLIGVPTYEDAPQTSDPRIENVSNAVLGVRAGLEQAAGLESFEGLAIYSYWVTDDEEWRDFRADWLGLEAAGGRGEHGIPVGFGDDS